MRDGRVHKPVVPDPGERPVHAVQQPGDQGLQGDVEERRARVADVEAHKPPLNTTRTHHREEDIFMAG